MNWADSTTKGIVGAMLFKDSQILDRYVYTSVIYYFLNKSKQVDT